MGAVVRHPSSHFQHCGGALLTMALYLLWRSTYYGALLTMAYFIVAATSSPPAELRSTTPHTTVESKPCKR
eukprot:scaffold12646_cov60-Phaeocystis_antarctica.AAC.8